MTIEKLAQDEALQKAVREWQRDPVTQIVLDLAAAHRTPQNLTPEVGATLSERALYLYGKQTGYVELLTLIQTLADVAVNYANNLKAAAVLAADYADPAGANRNETAGGE